MSELIYATLIFILGILAGINITIWLDQHNHHRKEKR